MFSKKPIDIDGSHLNLISFIKQNLDDLKEYATSQFSVQQGWHS